MQQWWCFKQYSWKSTDWMYWPY